MKIAFVIYEGMTILDFIGVYDPLTRLKSFKASPSLEWDLCAYSIENNKESISDLHSGQIYDQFGLGITPTKIGLPLAEYEMVIVPGGRGNRALLHKDEFLSWLRTISPQACLVSVCSGSLLLAAAGLIQGKTASTHPDAREELAQFGIKVSSSRLTEDGSFISSGGVTAGVDLGLYLCLKLAGKEIAEKIRTQMDYPWPILSPFTPGSSSLQAPRTGAITRQTSETNIRVSLNLDGTGQHQIDTGLPFLDHMLSQIAVHGIFDLEILAKGDLQIDPHHTLEDVALALGQAFREALGNRAGLVRMASAQCPMDESLAMVTVDFSGRPYAVFQVEWTQAIIAGIPSTLFAHFFESFATQAKCNLHACILYGRDDHHKAEALFKALGRALAAACQIDPRRSGAIPSSKGILF